MHASAQKLHIDTKGKFGFRSALTLIVVGKRRDVAGFFNLVGMLPDADKQYPITMYDLFHGRVEPERLEEFETEFSQLKSEMQKRPVSTEILSQAGFSVEFSRENPGKTFAEICSKHLEALERVIEGTRVAIDTRGLRPTLWFGATACSIPAIEIVKRFPRKAFFLPGPPWWLRDDLEMIN